MNLRMWMRMQMIESAVLCMVVAWTVGVVAQTNTGTAVPRPRKVLAAERQNLVEMISQRFGVKVAGQLGVRAAGAYRFAGTDDFFLIQRQDLGSVVFETKVYGTTADALEPKLVSQEVLLPRVEEALRRAGFDIPDKRFANFQDEFAGAFHERKDLPADFDPRKASKHVARTAAFERWVDGVPVFGSELLVGLNPDGTIGRFRMHWPKLDPAVVKAAGGLEAAVREKKWALPKDMQDGDTEILDVSAGVGHSAFVDPHFRSAAVVRVLYRKTGRDNPYPVATTGYRYFDAAGKEVMFNSFPAVRGTPASKKAGEKVLK